MPQPGTERAAARLAVVEEHVQCENQHDLDAVMATFGANARYDDESWDDHRIGRDGVRSYYAELLRSLPDLEIEIKHQHVATDSIVLEGTIRGTDLGPGRGDLPPTGRRVEFPLCAVYTFDASDRLAGERIYYDRGMLLRRLGLFHEPVVGLGRFLTVLNHPVTMARALLGRRPRTMRPDAA
jgi:steroid delta-isomerase-like uncharacterized protein